METAISSDPLLTASDPMAVELHNAHVDSPVLLLCEHAGNHVPAKLHRLGLDETLLISHIAWDIGAEPLARGLADRLQAPLIVQRYSRLVIDCNRPPDTAGSICATSDGVAVPGNARLDRAARAARRQAIFDPLDRAIAEAFEANPIRAAFSIHTFTPVFGGQARPWHAGVLTRQDVALAQAMMDHLAAQAPDLTLALNQPYQIDDASDWFIPQYAEPRGLRHALIEIRNDLVQDQTGQDRWADLLAGAIRHGLEDRP